MASAGVAVHLKPIPQGCARAETCDQCPIGDCRPKRRQPAQVKASEKASVCGKAVSAHD